MGSITIPCFNATSAPASSDTPTLFRNSADQLPVTVILCLTALDFVVYFTAPNLVFLVVWFLLMIIPKGCICAWNHHHQHTLTFRSAWMNRLLEQVYALHTGVTTHLWLLHHVLGHHHNYLDQRIDESRWQRRDGSTMGMAEYTIKVAATAYHRGWQVGRKHPRLLRIHLAYTAVTILLLAALVAWNPIAALFVFVLPVVNGLLITAWATYDHHVGLDTGNHFEASFNNLDPVFNFLTGNLGYHTAHHYRQGLHWSRLPALHQEISDHIPAELYIAPFWELFRQYLLRRLGLRA